MQLGHALRVAECRRFHGGNAFTQKRTGWTVETPREACGVKRTVALFALLVALSLAYRFPAIVNAGTVDSDAAIVGLQARHLLAGEWSWFLYGSGYQTSVDSCVAALFFAVLGSTSLALLLSTLIGHVAATCLAFGTLVRHLPRPSAFVGVLPLVFTSSPLHTYILNPPRQAALTLVFLAVFVIDGASGRRREDARRLQGALGAAIASLACFADPYALLVLPPLLVLALLACFDGATLRASGRVVLGRIAAGAVGAAVGLIPLALLLSSPRSVHGEVTLTSSVVRHNLALLVDPCLPWLLGATAYTPVALLGYVPWEPGVVLHALQRLGAAAFLVAIVSGVALAPSRARVDWALARLGAFGFLVAVLTIASFLVSVMVMDLFSSRYLAALVLMSPFALAPLAGRLGWKRLLLILAPYLTSAGVCGWVGYGDEVRGAHVVELPAEGAGDERALLGMLEDRGIHAAIADYWVSYRLTFLSREAVVVVPIHEREDRYPAYRTTYAGATRAAYIFDPKRSREQLSVMEAEAFSGPSPSRWGSPVERLHSGSLTAVVFDKPAL